MYQIVATTSTSTYPFKFFSVASTTKSSTNWATSTEYIFNRNDATTTVDQQFRNGTATGTAKTRYVHPDHLGSTNVVTDENGGLVQTLDYYPYGATRVSVSTSTDEKRKFIGQFRDDSGLDYLQARYYANDRGQFISQDPVFWELGITRDGKSALTNPQSQNSYGYANDNPINGKDPNGRLVMLVICPIDGAIGSVGAHTVLAVVPENPSTIGSINGVNTRQGFTLGGYTHGNGDLFKMANAGSDYAYAFGNQKGASQAIIAPPKRRECRRVRIRGSSDLIIPCLATIWIYTDLRGKKN